MENKQTVLVVDDDVINLEIVSEVLKSEKINIIRAQEGELAIKKAFEILPDLILLDIMMPVLDGFEVCKVLINDDKTKDIPILFLSAMLQNEDIIKGLKQGAIDYITKPFNSKELQARVETHLELKKNRDAYKKELRESIEKNDDYEKLLT